MLPAAIAGPYANRLAGTPAAISPLHVRRRRDHPARARQRRSPSRRRWIATVTASTPPATAREEHGVHDHQRTEQAADRRHQLHVAGAGGAEHVTWQHQHQSDDTPEHRRADRDAAEPERGEPETRAGHRAGQHVGNPPRSKIHDRRDEQTGGQHRERHASKL